MTSASLGSYVDRMDRWGDRNFLVGRKGYRSRPWTYRAAAAAIRRLAAGFADGELPSAAIGAGDRVVIHGRSCPEWVVAYFAVLGRKAVVVPLDRDTAPEFVRRVLKKAKPSLVVGEPLPLRTRMPFLPFSRIAELGKQTPGANARPPDRPPAGEKLRGENTQKDTPQSAKAGADAPKERRRGDGGDLAEIVFTSGTTSDPKGVMLTHGNILSNLRPIAEGIERHERLVRFLTPFRMLCAVPYSHMFGQAVGIFLPILFGSTVYFTDDTSPSALVRAIRRDRILTLITVPRVMKLIADHVKSELASRGRMPSFERRWDRMVKIPYPLRVPFYLDVHRIMGLHFWSFIVGGAPLDRDTHEFWRRLVFSVFQGYGLTEAAPMVSMFNPFRHNRRSVGKIFPGQEVRIGPEGEILLRGDNVMAGYYGDPAGTRSTLQDGWLRTGDIGEIDREGHLFIKGRIKDMICTPDGRNVFAEDVEGVLRGAPGVRDAVVYGEQEGAGETVHAVLILNRGADGERAVRAANARLLPYQRVRGFSTWAGDDFPRTSTLKVRKSEVVRLVCGEKRAETETGSLLRGLVPGRADPNSKLGSELGLDSLDLVEVVARVERKFGVSIDESAVGPESTLAGLEALAASAAGSSPVAFPAPAAGPAPSATAAGADVEAVAGATALAAPRAAELSMPRWARFAPVRTLRRLVMDLAVLPAFRVPFRVRARYPGTPSEWTRTGWAEPFIVAANHTSNLDPIFLLLALPPRLRGRVSPAMGLNRFHASFTRFSTEKRPPQKGVARVLMPALHRVAYVLVTLLFQTFPFPQGTAYRSSLEYTGELLDRGVSILIFPEGEVNEAGGAGKTTGAFKTGVAKIADLTEAAVVPAGIRWERGRDRGFPRLRPRITVSFGRPMQYRSEGYEEFTGKLQAGVRRLLR